MDQLSFTLIESSDVSSLKSSSLHVGKLAFDEFVSLKKDKY